MGHTTKAYKTGMQQRRHGEGAPFTGKKADTLLPDAAAAKKATALTITAPLSA
jgi:hypothetical protein